MDDFEKLIPDCLKQFSKMLYTKYNKRLYICGGFVRDTLLGYKNNGDIDIASEIQIDEMRRIVNDTSLNVKFIDDGLYENMKSHGTCILYFKDEKFSVEHTTFRNDVQTNGRNATISYTKSIHEDSMRRDFTINGMYYDMNDKKILDFWGGAKDLNDKVIRFIGNPISRIYEDHLRLIRYYRFLHNLNFKPDERSRTAVYKLAFLLSRISTERVNSEINKIVSSDFIHDGIIFNILNEFDIEEIKEKHHIIKILIDMKNCRFTNPAHITSDLLSHSLNVIKRSNGFIYSDYKSDPHSIFDIRFCALFHDILKLKNKIWVPERHKHTFINHDNIIQKDNLNFLEKFKTKAKISNALFKDLKFVIETHMMVWDCDNQKSIFKFIYNKLNSDKNIHRFLKYYPVYIGDCKVEKSPDKLTYILGVIDNIKNEIYKVHDIVKCVDIKPYIEHANDKSRLKKLKEVMCKSKYIYNKELNEKEVINILNG